MFAHGKTVQRAQRQGVCDPECNTADSDRASGQADALVAALTSEAPSERPSANEAMGAPFFVILNDVCKRVRKTCVLCNFQGDDAKRQRLGAQVMCCKFPTDAGLRPCTTETLPGCCLRRVSTPCCRQGSSARKQS